ncbi:MAG: hypothetical protein O7C61_03370 [SAR324 cluster bacterium]|nr:hypothetical protein [SAR324 cluster bacterium]
MTGALHLLSATRLLHACRAKQLSPLEATKAVFARIAACNEAVNAFCRLDEQGALASVPRGMTGDGLSVGLQIIGPKYGDALVPRAARACESVRGPFPRPFLEQ